MKVTRQGREEFKMRGRASLSNLESSLGTVVGFTRALQRGYLVE